MPEMKQRPIICGGNVSGHAVVTIEIRYDYELDEVSGLNFYGEIDDTAEDLEDQLNAEIEQYVAHEIECTMERLGYCSGEPEVICANGTDILDYEISDLEIEMEDVEEDDDA